MKTLIFLSILNLGFSCSNKPNDSVKTIGNDKQLIQIVDSLESSNSNNNIQEERNTEKRDTITQENIQYEDFIEEAISKTFKEKKISHLDKKIEELDNDKKINKSYKIYWKTYMYYYKSLFYKNSLKDDDEASKYIDLAILEIEQNLISTEDYALYASCLSFSIQFANMTQLSRISSKVEENANKALELNNKNIRAYLVLASHNFYTPKMFGGMTKVEENAIKGIACPNSLSNDYYEPYWGKPRLYEILIKYYESEKRKEDVIKIKQLAKKEFPNTF